MLTEKFDPGSVAPVGRAGRTADHGPDLFKAQAAPTTGHDDFALLFREFREGFLQRFEHGLTSEKHVPREFFDSAEYLRIAELAETLSDLIGPGGKVIRGIIEQTGVKIGEA